MSKPRPLSTNPHLLKCEFVSLLVHYKSPCVLSSFCLDLCGGVLWHIWESLELSMALIVAAALTRNPVCPLNCFSVGVIPSGRKRDAVQFRRVWDGTGLSAVHPACPLTPRSSSLCSCQRGKQADKTKRAIFLRGKRVGSRRLMSSGRCTQAQYLQRNLQIC